MRRGVLSDAPIPAVDGAGTTYRAGARGSVRPLRAAGAVRRGRAGASEAAGARAAGSSRARWTRRRRRARRLAGPHRRVGRRAVGRGAGSTDRSTSRSSSCRSTARRQFPTSRSLPIPAGTQPRPSSRASICLRSASAKTASGTLTATFVDTAGVSSEVAERAGQPTAIAGGRWSCRPASASIWTSRPGPAPDVELKLVWPAKPDTRYRVYVADQKGLAVAGDVARRGGGRRRPARSRAHARRTRSLPSAHRAAARGRRRHRQLERTTCRER